MLTHVDLFSGIGGFSLAAGWAGFRTVAFCEIEPFCQEVLRERFGAVADAEHDGLPVPDGQGKATESSEPPGANRIRKSQGGDSLPILIPDIRTLDGSRFRGATLLTGGFPCQPFSVAGKRKGKDDGRHLWPEMLRVIHEAKPRWVIGENVAGFVNMALDEVCADLEGEGYEVQPIIIPACAVNAPHRRDRVWIIGYRNEPRKDARSEDCRSRDSVGEPDSHADDAEKRGRGQEYQNSGGSGERTVAPEERGGPPDPRWDIPWPEVASRLCALDDGLPLELPGRPLRNKNRAQRLKAVGNAIVPSVAYEIIRRIAEIEMTAAQAVSPEGK